MPPMSALSDQSTMNLQNLTSNENLMNQIKREINVNLQEIFEIEEN